MKAKLARVIGMAALAVFLVGVLAACGGSQAGSSPTAGERGTITVAATPAPHADILRDAVAPKLAEQGYELVVREYTDYVLPNTATEEGEVDANFFQHEPYLDNFNAEQKTHLISVAGVHIEPMVIYAGKSASLNSLPDGAKVALPNDATNEGRALLLLQTAGLIKLSDPGNLEATPGDIAENPKNLSFVEVDADAVPTVLADVDVAVVNGNYVISAELSSDKILLTEGAESPYVNVIVVKEGNEKSPGIQALVDATLSEEVRTYINEKYNGEVVTIF